MFEKAEKFKRKIDQGEYKANERERLILEGLSAFGTEDNEKAAKIHLEVRKIAKYFQKISNRMADRNKISNRHVLGQARSNMRVLRLQSYSNVCYCGESVQLQPGSTVPQSNVRLCSWRGTNLFTALINM